MGCPLSPRDVESHRKNKPSAWRDWATVVMWSVVGYLCIISMVVTYFSPSILPLDLFALLFHKEVSPFFAFSHGSGHFPKPSGFKIVALVPFNHHERTAILDCYLQKNLVHNHGFLDEVVFVPQTEDTASLDWLMSLVDQTPEYIMSGSGTERDWNVAEDNVMYIRIDGDVVFLEDHTIPTIVKTKLNNPSSLMVSANVVNEAALASLHSHPGVALPYLPELHRTEPPSQANSQLSQDWRASSLPLWQGSPSFRVGKEFTPPFEGHRWLLPTAAGSDLGPIAESVYTDTGPSLSDWTVAAQQHYSFLYHLEAGDLGHYKFPLWIDPTEPTSEHFGCFWGNDAQALGNIFQHGDSSPDELLQSWTTPDDTHPHVVIDGKGLVSHYSARQGASGLDSTDLLNRYRAYAQEKVCLQKP
ncbi:hypothetical protein NUU61_005590 [Penicillium alfredii]|uniref:Uncharacterized protein n=1 Tax=Penicillium alfredii TaxID=1506179 RepID=A0A9W9F9V3_9EURO|nr:uncharacterized protein NUU61_005590 [Penicillium alfredii]KAJ5096234.1 hypothetical protein NUU61_005590 [Penicillium alfredii]